MAYYSTHDISQFLLNNEKQRVRFLLARPVFIIVYCCECEVNMHYSPIIAVVYTLSALSAH